jgi:membrane-associated phospholipid phosphatase
MSDEVRKPIIGSILCALALLPLALLAYVFAPTSSYDARLLSRIAEPNGTSGHELASVIAHLCDPLPIFAMAAVITLIGLAGGRRRELVAAAAVVFGANLSTQVLKHVLSHHRWDDSLIGLHAPWEDAFPSGHTTAAAAIAVALVLVVAPRARPLAAALGAAFTLAVGISVVVIQWHYPSDVLGGLLVVGSWTFAAIAGLRLTRPRQPDAPRDAARESQAPGRLATS